MTSLAKQASQTQAVITLMGMGGNKIISRMSGIDAKSGQSKALIQSYTQP
ncbi:hypothetical protein [Deinococcus psychrotolerans]|nr:hypothetical protein [Deinococcus psychrotolerans]